LTVDLERRVERLEQRLEEETRMGVLDLLLLHPLKHATKPGVKNKIEAGIGIAGRGAVGYGIYRGAGWLIGKIMGA
jgi:hypothetical protein